MNNDLIRWEASGVDIELTIQEAKTTVPGANKATDEQVYQFLRMCQAKCVNPFAGDAHLAVFNGRASVIVGKDYYMRVAAQNPQYDGLEAGILVGTQDGQLARRPGSILFGNEFLVGAYCTVYSKDKSHPSYAEVSMTEYAQNTPIWSEKPATMIRKVAIVQALREAFPQSFAGIYDEAEMHIEAELSDIQEDA